jgi:hypothetical protein
MGREIKSSEKLNTYLTVVTFFSASLVLGDYGIRFYVHILQAEVPHRVIAGFTEPITTKLFPGVAVVYVFHRYDVPTTLLQSHPYWFAFLGGLSLGVFERILYIIVREASISLGFVLAPGMHTLNAMLIAGFIFRSTNNLEGSRFFVQLLLLIILAMVIHVLWNTWGVLLIYQAFA